MPDMLKGPDRTLRYIAATAALAGACIFTADRCFSSQEPMAEQPHQARSLPPRCGPEVTSTPEARSARDGLILEVAPAVLALCRERVGGRDCGELAGAEMTLAVGTDGSLELERLSESYFSRDYSYEAGVRTRYALPPPPAACTWVIEVFDAPRDRERPSPLPIPLRQEPLQECPQEGVALLGHPLPGLGVHAPLQ